MESPMKSPVLPASFPFGELADDLAIQGKVDFCRRFPNPVLLLESMPNIDEQDIIVNTEITDLKEPRRAPTEPGERRVVLLAKSGNNQYTERITVGRARNNDIVIRAQKISKLHAMFVPVVPGRYALMDMGSRNGTEVNGRRLAPKESATLQSGDRVAFWRCVFQYLEPDAFIARLRQHTGK